MPKKSEEEGKKNIQSISISFSFNFFLSYLHTLLALQQKNEETYKPSQTKTWCSNLCHVQEAEASTTILLRGGGGVASFCV